MREKNLVQRIKSEILNNKVKEPFRSSDFAFLSKSKGFLSKHCVEYGKETEHFIRVKKGHYKLK